MWDSDAENFDETLGEEECVQKAPNRNRSVREYKRMARIGEGTYGTVYRVEERAGGGVYAAKVLNLRAMRHSCPNSGSALPKLALREVSNHQKSQQHAHVISIHEVVENSSNVPILILPLMDMDLTTFTERLHTTNTPLPDPLLSHITFAVTSAVSSLHAQHILHRDIKPGNILLDTKGNVLLCDFGSSRIGGSGENSGAITPSSIRTTRLYRSPECILGAPSYGYPLDVWGVGCCVYEVAVGAALLEKCETDIVAIGKVLHVVGWPPAPEEWPDQGFLKTAEVFELQAQPAALGTLLAQIENSAARQFTAECLTRSPHARPSAAQLLDHPFLNLTTDPAQRASLLATLVSTLHVVEEKTSRWGGVSEANMFDIGLDRFDENNDDCGEAPLGGRSLFG